MGDTEVRRLQLEIIMDETGAIVGAKNVSKANKKLEKSTEKTAKKMSGFTKTIKSNWLGIAAVVAGAFIAIKKAFDLSKAFLEYRQGMDALARNTGQNADKIVEKLSEITKGTVANKDIMLAANRLVALNVTKDTDKMADLFEIARVKAKAMGITTTQAVNDIATGIGRNSPMILDNLGIITKGWDEEAKAAGKAMDSQFILNKILKQGAEELKKTGATALTGAERMQKLDAATSNLKIAFGKFVSDGMGPVVTWMTKTITVLGDMMTAFAKTQQQMNVSKKALSEFGVESSKQVRAVEDLSKAYLKWADAGKTVATAEKTIEIVRNQGRPVAQWIFNSLKRAKTDRAALGEEMRKYKKALEDTDITTGKKAAEAMGVLEEAIKDLNKPLKEPPAPPPSLDPLSGKDKDKDNEELKGSVADFYAFVDEQRKLDLLKEEESRRLALEGLAQHQLNKQEIKEIEAIKDEEKRTEKMEQLLADNAFFEQLEQKHQMNIAKIKADSDKRKQKKETAIRKAELTATRSALGDISGLTASSNKKLFKIGKTAAIARAIINVIESVTKTMASVPLPFNIPLAALQSVAGFAQVDKIKSQTMGEGGQLAGPSHAQGGINVNAEGGEYFVRKQNVTAQTLPVLTAINKGMSNLTSLSIPANSPVHGMQGGGVVNNRDNRRQVSIEKVEIASDNPEELFSQFMEFGEDMGVIIDRRG